MGTEACCLSHSLQGNACPLSDYQSRCCDWAVEGRYVYLSRHTTVNLHAVLMWPNQIITGQGSQMQQPS